MEFRAELELSLGAAYKIVRELAGGGMSRVFLAEETALKRQVVIKALPPELTAGVSIERFQREIMLAARLQHAHIVPLITAGNTGVIPWFTMPFVEGQSLRDRLSHGELPVPEAIRVLRDIAAALAYAHEKGVVHRDIKPGNVLLSDGHALVTDFGVAKALGIADDGQRQALTSVGVALGTPSYMAPEQITADPTTDHRADLYALGVVAYELLSGRNPFGGRSPQATLAAHITEAPVAIDSIRPIVPAALAAIIMRCLAKSPADRPQSARDIVQQLDALSTSSSSPSTATRTAVRKWRRWLMANRVAAGGALFLTIAAGIALLTRDREPSLVRRRVAVVPLENLTGDTSLAVVGRIAANWLTEGIAQSDSADVVSSSVVAEVAADAAAGSADMIRRIVSATKAGALIIGSYTRFGDSLRVQADLVNARTLDLIRAIGSTTGPVSDPLVAINRLRELVLGSLAVGDLQRRVTVTGAPPKYSAYREYLAGQERFSRGDLAGARQFLKRAIDIDATFFAPHLLLAATYTMVGDLLNAERVVAHLDSLREQLSTTDRLGLDLTRAIVTGDHESELKTAQLLSTRLADPSFGFLIGRSATRLLLPRIAIPALLSIDATVTGNDKMGQIVLLANAYHLNADYASELATLERGRREFPGVAYIEDAELAVLAALHEQGRALALTETMLRSRSAERVGDRFGAVLAGAMEFGAHGDSVTARRLAQTVLDWAHAHPVSAPISNRPHPMGVAFLIVGALDSAEAHFRVASRDTLNASIGGLLGLVAARRGDTARAHAISDSLGALQRRWTFGLIPFLRAGILGQLGEQERAMDLLRQSVKEGMPKMYFHYVESLASLRGYPPFQAMVTPER